MVKRVLITGIGGSIGVHVLRHIMVNTDWEVVGIDSFRHVGLTDRITRVMAKHPETKPRLSIFTHDLRAPISLMLRKQMGHVDYIINLASMPDVAASIIDPLYTIRANTEIMMTMLEYARDVGCDAFLHVSTDEVYGQSDGKYYHREWDPIMPSSPYSASKAAQEAYAFAYWRTYNTPVIIVNLMNNFAEMQSPFKFPSIVIRKVTRGETVTIHGSATEVGTRFYIHSRNSADAMLFILRHGAPHSHTEGAVDRPDRYNVVGSRWVSNLELAHMIAGYIGKPLKYQYEDFAKTRPGHDFHYGLDGRKLDAMGWKPPVSFEVSLQRTVEWYGRNPEWLEAQ